MIPIDGQVKKKIAIHISRADGKGTYPERRAALIAGQFKDEVDEIIFLCGEMSPEPPEGFRVVAFEGHVGLAKALTELEPDLLIRDSGATIHEEVEKIRELVPSIIHFDDFGDGGRAADLVFQTLYADSFDDVPEHYVVGKESFIVDDELSGFKEVGLRKERPGPLPHLVISFGDEDEGNLSYRALRHMLQLQIPLKVSLLIGKRYTHDISELRLMALGRRNTKIIEHPYSSAEVYASADIILCASGYMPYEVAVMGIPCVILAQNDFEVGLAFPKEQHGFINLGLGRKVKQSSLLNAIMEPLLHEPLRKKSIAKQTALGLGGGKEDVCEAIRYYLEYPKRAVYGSTGKSASDMVH